MAEASENGLKECVRLQEDETRGKNWKRWGPYLSERQWATVREDYSPDGSCWDYFSHDHARSRTYRWGEDGLLGITDRQARLCFALALWNGKDSILKERLFGLTGSQGNHGEDAKECYYYLESTPTHSYMKALYKYPQQEYPYAWLTEENGRRSKTDPEFELEDTGIFDGNEYWDVFAEYAKNDPDDVLIKITVANRGPKSAVLHLLPTLWYRNTWSWGCTHEGCTLKPKLSLTSANRVNGSHQTLGKMCWELEADPNGKTPTILFTDNDTNYDKMWGTKNESPYVKDAFHRYVIEGETAAVNPKQKGTKVAAYYTLNVKPGSSVTLRSRLFVPTEPMKATAFGKEFDITFKQRKQESEEFFQHVCGTLPADQKLIAKQAMAGLLWSKQFYHISIKHWLEGDPDYPPPPESRKNGRNKDWNHLYNRDIISMPDKWEYPWYASWDLAFHMIPFSMFDIDFAKSQLILFLREWYMHPNGQIPAYEFAFDDVNPPVHAWAVMKVYRAQAKGKRDIQFLERCFQKLILNFTWWVNRKDPHGKNIFAGGFLGLDNIGIFDRSRPLPAGMELEQADGTAWMAVFCLVMLDMALELALKNPIYEDMASKFFEHFIFIVDAINTVGQGGGLWHEEDGFYYDYLRTENGESIPLRIRSLVGIVPIFSCLVLEQEMLTNLKDFMKRTNWFVKNRKDLLSKISYMDALDGRFLLAIPSREQLVRILRYVLDENEFLSQYGIRSLSKVHKFKPFELNLPGCEKLQVHYIPGESDTYLFGGNSNWRGPIWFCMNYFIIDVLRRYHYYFGSSFKVECPTNSGNYMTLDKISDELCRRLTKLFLPDKHGERPCNGPFEKYAKDPAWKDLVLFYEYFHGDSGRGCGASHQTGWTALILNCMMTMNNQNSKK